MNSTTPEPAPTSDEKTMATLAHVLQIVTWWVAPLVIYLIKRESKFVAFHAMQALLWQVVMLVLWMGAVVTFMAVFFATAFHHAGSAGAQDGPPAAFFLAFPVFWLLIMGVSVLNLVIAIVYGVKAGRGEWAAYPVIGGWARSIVKL